MVIVEYDPDASPATQLDVLGSVFAARDRVLREFGSYYIIHVDPLQHYYFLICLEDEGLMIDKPTEPRDEDDYEKAQKRKIWNAKVQGWCIGFMSGFSVIAIYALIHVTFFQYIGGLTSQISSLKEQLHACTEEKK